MRPEDVPQQWWDAALIAYHRNDPHEGPAHAMRAALAAVIPAVEDAASERAAVMVAEYPPLATAPGEPGPTRGDLQAVAAAIRALKETT